MQYSFKGFLNPNCQEKLDEYEDKWINSLIQVNNERDYQYSQWFFMGLHPITDDFDRLKSKMENLLKKVDENHIHLQK